MLIDDEAVGETKPRGEAHAAGDHRRTLVTGSDHVVGKDAGPRARATHRDPMRVAEANEPGNGRAAEERGEPQLVSAREEYAAGFLDARKATALTTVAARVEVHYRDAGGAERLEELLVARASLVHAAGGGNHDDIG